MADVKIKCTHMVKHLILIKLEEFGDFSAPKKFQHLIPFVDNKKPVEELPLFFFQITYMRCGGLTLGIMISHAVADGSGLLDFINDWARYVYLTINLFILLKSLWLCFYLLNFIILKYI